MKTGKEWKSNTHKFKLFGYVKIIILGIVTLGVGVGIYYIAKYLSKNWGAIASFFGVNPNTNTNINNAAFTINPATIQKQQDVVISGLAQVEKKKSTYEKQQDIKRAAKKADPIGAMLGKYK